MAITADQVLRMPIEIIALDHYLPEKAKRKQKNTVYGYKSSIKLHVIPKWGKRTLSDITHDEVQEWVDELAQTEAGVGGAEKAYKCLRQIVRWSMAKWSLLIVEVTQHVEMPRKPIYKPETLTQRRLKRMIRGFVGCGFEPTLIIQTALGTRPSENYALDWEDINWRTGMVSIRRTLHELPSGVYVGPTKTAKSERDLYLPAWALERLHDIWIERGRPRGRIIGMAKPSKVFRALKRWAEANRLPWVGMRNLRHTWATLAIHAGVPIEHAAAMLGHTDVNTCYRYYMAISDAAKRRAQRKFSRLVLGKTCDDMYKGVIVKFSTPEGLAMAA